MKIFKKNRWIKFRHRVVRNILYILLYPYSRVKYNIKIEKFKGNSHRPYLILLNHQTPFDQFFVGMSFKNTVYYLATEDIFSMGWISSVIRFLVAPIPIKKQTTDVKAVLNCLRIAKEGGTIAIAPEGNRTYSGRTGYIKPSIVPLIRSMKLPVVFFRIEGGYGTQPRWSDVVRKGIMKAYPSGILEQNIYSEMTDEELYSHITKELYVDEAKTDHEYKHKKSAEYLERAIYVCPYCGLSAFESHDDIFQCMKCGKKVSMLPTKELKGIGFDFKFRFIGNWYDYQMNFIADLNLAVFNNVCMYSDNVSMYEVIPYERKELISHNVSLELFGNKITLLYGDMHKDFIFDDIFSVTVLGRNKLNVYTENNIYQFKGNKRFNALKYVQIFNKYKNNIKGDKNAKFLGL